MKKTTFIRLFATLLSAVMLMPSLSAAAEGFEKRYEYGDSVFTDVKEEDWFAENVSAVYEYGIMNGTGNGKFSPGNPVSFAAVLTMAARLHSVYNTGNDVFEKSDPWYRAYVDYCTGCGIVTAEELPDDMDSPADRAFCAHVFSQALPASEYEAVNTVEDGAIPDVAPDDRYADDIYLLYRAGVTIGSDKKGTFNPKSDIKRSEIAAITTRIIDHSLRKTVTLPEPVRDPSTIYKRVVIIGVDGGGVFFRDTDTPNIDKIFENGAVTYKAQTMDPSISGECWGSMMHGVLPAVHGIGNSSGTEFPENTPFPSFFNLLRQNDSECDIASIVNWATINAAIVENRIGVYKDGAEEDDAVTEKVIEYLDTHDPKLLYVHFDGVDHQGHAHGYGSPEHLAEITKIDGYIGQIYDELVKLGYADDTLFIVVPDHGGTYSIDEDGNSSGSHGGTTEEEMTIMVAITGKTVMKGEIGEMDIRDIASITAYALGLEQPETWSARLPEGIFEGVGGGERPGYVFPDYVARWKNEGIPTPEEGSGTTLTDYIPSEDIVEYMALDGSVKNSMGSPGVTLKGKGYFVDGYMGEGMRTDDAYILARWVPDDTSFSVSLWANIRPGTANTAIISNTEYWWDQSEGFTLFVNGGNLVFHLRENGTENRYDMPLPGDFRNGWLHLIFIVDREMGKITVCFDFGESVVSFDIWDEVKDLTFNGALHGIMFAHHHHYLAATLDEIVIYNRALTEEDISALKEYYKAEKPE